MERCRSTSSTLSAHGAGKMLVGIVALALLSSYAVVHVAASEGHKVPLTHYLLMRDGEINLLDLPADIEEVTNSFHHIQTHNVVPHRAYPHHRAVLQAETTTTTEAPLPDTTDTPAANTTDVPLANTTDVPLANTTEITLTNTTTDITLTNTSDTPLTSTTSTTGVSLTTTSPPTAPPVTINTMTNDSTATDTLPSTTNIDSATTDISTDPSVTDPSGNGTAPSGDGNMPTGLLPKETANWLKPFSVAVALGPEKVDLPFVPESLASTSVFDHLCDAQGNNCPQDLTVVFTDVQLFSRSGDRPWPVTPDTQRRGDRGLNSSLQFTDPGTAATIPRDPITGVPLTPTTIDIPQQMASRTSQGSLRRLSETARVSITNDTAPNAAPTPPPKPMKWIGGKMKDAVYVHLIFVGNSWDVKSVKEYSSVINSTIHFLAYVDGSDWFNTARHYQKDGVPRYNPTQGLIQLKQAKILPIVEDTLASEDDLIDYLGHYLTKGKLQYYPDVSTYIFMLPNTNGRQVVSPGNNESCSNWCGLHSFVPAEFKAKDGSIYNYNITYGVITHPLSCASLSLSRCALNGLWQSDPVTGKPYAPNSFAADAMISVLGHEITEIFTDPFQDAWQDEDGKEAGDKCNFDFGTVMTDPTWWTNMVGGRKFLVQQVWNPLLQKCANKS